MKGVYTIPELSRYVGIKPDRARRWFCGKGSAGGKRKVEPLFEPDHDRVAGKVVLSFYNLIDAFVAAKLTELGVTFRELWAVYNHLQQRYQSKHAFCRKDLLTDGRKIFVHDDENENEKSLVELPSNQYYFEEILTPSLHKIEYDEISGLANRWRIFQGVLIDPEISFGEPVVADAFVPTETLNDAYLANDRDRDLVRRMFRVTEEQLDVAIRFQQSLAA